MIVYDRILHTLKDTKNNETKEVGKLNKSAFTRIRKMPFDSLLRFIMNLKGKTTTMELNNYFKEIDKREDTITKRAFSKQRKNLNPQLFKHLTKNHINRFYEFAQVKKYKGYILAAIDGSHIEIPNTKELQEEYNCISTGQSKHRSIARALASGIYDIENKIMIDTVLGSRSDGERALAKQNIDSDLELMKDIANLIIIFDRGYASIDMILTLIRKDVKYLFRLRENMFKKERSSVKSNDEFIDIALTKSRTNKIEDDLNKNLAEELKNLNCRLVKVKLSSGETEYLLTNIDNVEMDTKEIGELYYKRWGIELAYDVTKNKLNIENISGKSRLVVEQDFYAQILLFNMVEDLRSNADEVVKEKKKDNLKYDYKVNMNILVGTFRDYMIKIAIEEDDLKREKMYTWMLDEIISNLVPIRLNRNYPRKPYSGANKHRLNSRRNS